MNQVVIDLTVILFANVVLEKRRKKRIRRISNITKKLQKLARKLSLRASQTYLKVPVVILAKKLKESKNGFHDQNFRRHGLDFLFS